MELWRERCRPARKGERPLSSEKAAELLTEVPGWIFQDGELQLLREFLFPDFRQAIRFVNDVATVAEAAGHHPDIHVHYDRVKLVLWTHSIGGLSRNDFILAAKINAIQAGRPPAGARRRNGS